MTDPIKAPERHVVFSCEIGADSGSELARELRRLADLADSERMPKNSAWGGYSNGGHLTYRVNPGVTGDSFRAELAAWMERADEDEPSGPCDCGRCPDGKCCDD